MARAVQIPITPNHHGNQSVLAGDLHPPTTGGLVIFAHGSGSSRFSSRNRYVARVLQDAGLGTLLIDLLTEQEGIEDERTRELRFNIPLLGQRVMRVIDWVRDPSSRYPDLAASPIGLFGASTGAAAALIAASEMPQAVQAVVSRGGRPDLAGTSALGAVRAPALFLVGSLDHTVLQLNRDAIAQFPPTTTRDLQIIDGATHLFEEPGTLDQVAGLAAAWFTRYLMPSR